MLRKFGFGLAAAAEAALTAGFLILWLGIWPVWRILPHGRQ